MAAPTTSGTVAFKLDILQLCEEAWERAGREMRTGYDLRTARRSLNIMFLEWSNRGINLWTVTEATVSLTDGTKTYALADDMVSFLEGTVRQGSGTSQTDYSLTLISASTYAQRTNKNTEARPTEMYLDRQNRHTVTFWPVPPDDTFTFVYWYLRRIEDAGTNTNNPDMPERFIPALASGLAYYIAMKQPELEKRVPTLKAIYEEQFELAASEDRTKTPLVFVPLAGYVDMDFS